MEDASNAITRILSDPVGVPHDAAAALLPLVYEQLRHAAAAHLRAEPSGHTLQPTALVHEVFIKLSGPREVPWANRAHYYAAAAQAMRRILIDHARSKGARKGREAAVRGLADVATLAQQDPGTILAVDAALARLEGEDPEAATIVKLRFFAGLSVEQSAMAMGISPRTAARLWALARARLHGYLTEQKGEAGNDT